MIVLALAAAAAALKLPALHTYKDWIVGCDNIRSCQANALAPEDGGDNYLMLTITRAGTPGDPARLNLPLPDKTAVGARFALKVDGTIVASFTARATDTAAVPLTRPMLAALASGSRIALFDAGGQNIGEASLAGLAAALLYVDVQQQRIGTVGALKAAGPKPDADVPAPPLAPLIVTPAPSNKPPRMISVALAIKLIGPDAATCDYATGKVSPRSYRLDAGHSVVLIDNPCGNGAYNYFTSVYVLDESGPPREALFDLAPGMGEGDAGPGSADLTNGDWDPKSRQMSSFEKGRGIGDCGTTEAYAWDGSHFRLVEQTEMGECRGSADYIRLWTARTSR